MSDDLHLGWRSERVGSLVHLVTALPGKRFDRAELGSCVADAIAAGRRLVVVDLSGLDDVPSEVLEVLVRANHRLGWRNSELAIVSPRDEGAAQTMAARDESLELYETLDEVAGVA